jgi:DNA primase catalytic subunit
MEEIWKDIDGYDDYKISNLGRIRSFKPVAYKCVDGILKQSISKGGYCVVGLQKNGNRKGFLVHRLVAQAFISNPENKPCVNHISGVKDDNSIENLEWVTYSENEKHAYNKLGKKSKSNGIAGRIGKANPNSKPVICLNNNEYFESASLASKKLNVSIDSVCCVCKGKFKQVKGYLFKYA